MEEYIVHSYFTDVKRSKYIYEANIPRGHSFSGLKASIANICEVQSTELTFQGQTFIILSACWTKPHFFVINTTNNNIMWAEGTASLDLNFKQKYSTFISLSKWIKTLQKLAHNQVVVEWARHDQFIKPKQAVKKLKTIGQC